MKRILPTTIVTALSLVSALSFQIHRPNESTWKRTKCGSPSSSMMTTTTAAAADQADIPSRWTAEVSAKKTPLPAYPRPQMVRGDSDLWDSHLQDNNSLDSIRERGKVKTWTNLNGLWEWEKTTTTTTAPPFGRNLSGSILVPFPVESCLSGVAPTSSADVVKSMWYRLTFDNDNNRGSSSDNDYRTLLHFGAVDWHSSVYLNGVFLGNHTGGYDGFEFDITDVLATNNKRSDGNSTTSSSTTNEILVYAYDPSDEGVHPNGKQRISAISHPGGDTYTPSSGIWQTVWLEQVPAAAYVESLRIDQASLSRVVVAANVKSGEDDEAVVVFLEVIDSESGDSIANATGAAGENVTITIPEDVTVRPWSPEDPYLYDLIVTIATPEGNGDSVLSYFGLRTFELLVGDGSKKEGNKRPFLNGNFTFLIGLLDQSWWPDGQYTAPTDDALAYDIEAVPMFGMNTVRLHQKVNPERWYYHADRLGVVVLQDMVQKYGGASNATISYFVDDFEAIVRGPRSNHPCIVQYTIFNEADCWTVFNNETKPYDVAGMVSLSKDLDPSRLVDTDSGGKANNMGIGDVNDIHSYPDPGDPLPSTTQYAMIGEFGGIGAFVAGKEWKPNSCYAYLKVDTPHDAAKTYIQMAATIESRVVDHGLSAAIYTQTTDVELECDGFLNYDRSNKFSDDDTAAIRAANRAIIQAGRKAASLEEVEALSAVA